MAVCSRAAPGRKTDRGGAIARDDRDLDDRDLDDRDLGDQLLLAADSEALERVARVGYAASGVLHLAIGVLAVRVALGAQAHADQSGALSGLAARPLGHTVLWVAVVGLLALALWQAGETVIGAPRDEPADRAAHVVKSASKSVVYLVLAWTAATFALGSGSSSAEQTRDVVTWLVGTAGGRALVVVAGLVVLGVGIYHVVKGVRRRFVRDLERGTTGDLGRAVLVLGQVGYVAKGIALGIVGVLLVLAGFTADASDATGLDGALHTLGEQPAGPVLLVATGLGFVAYGLYSFARTRYARM